MLIILLNYNFSNKIILIQLKLNLKKSLPNAIKSAIYSVTSNNSQYIYNKNLSKSTLVCLVLRQNSSTHLFRDVILYATLRGYISVGDALIDVWFSLVGLSYSLAYTYKVLRKLFFHALWTLITCQLTEQSTSSTTLNNFCHRITFLWLKHPQCQLLPLLYLP